jgi:hypothetical protein
VVETMVPSVGGRLESTVRTVVLTTPEEVDAAVQLHPDYTPPSAG